MFVLTVGSVLSNLYFIVFSYVCQDIIFMFPIHFLTEGEMEKERSLSSFHCHSKELQDNATKVKPSKVLLKCTSRGKWAGQERQGLRNSGMWAYTNFSLSKRSLDHNIWETGLDYIIISQLPMSFPKRYSKCLPWGKKPQHYFRSRDRSNKDKGLLVASTTNLTLPWMGYCNGKLTASWMQRGDVWAVVSWGLPSPRVRPILLLFLPSFLA